MVSELQTRYSGVYVCVLPQSLCADPVRGFLFSVRPPSLPLLMTPDFQSESTSRVCLQKALGTRRAWQLPPPLLQETVVRLSHSL